MQLLPHTTTAVLALTMSAMLLGTTGCQTLREAKARFKDVAGGRTSKVKNPVLGPPPPRVLDRFDENEELFAASNRRDAARADGDFSNDPIRTVSSSSGDQDANNLELRGQVAATVNGVPIFAEEILEQNYGVKYAAGFSAMRSQLDENEYTMRLAAAIHNNDGLQTAIQRELLLQSLRKKVPEEQVKQIYEQINERFAEDRLPEMLKQSNATTEQELEQIFAERGESLKVHRGYYANQMIAMQYMYTKAKPRVDYGKQRKEKYDYYVEHIDEYKLLAEVEWQELMIAIDGRTPRSKALARAKELRAELNNGADFDELARKNSAGPTASKGGRWGWTTAGSLANEDLEKLLMQIPIGELSDPIVDERGVRVVRVLDRREARTKSFDEVQNDIKSILENAEFAKGAQATLRELELGADVQVHIHKPDPEALQRGEYRPMMPMSKSPRQNSASSSQVQPARGATSRQSLTSDAPQRGGLSRSTPPEQHAALPDSAVESEGESSEWPRKSKKPKLRELTDD